METGDRGVAHRALGAEVTHPCARLAIERQLGAWAVDGRRGGRRRRLHATNHRRDRAHAASISSPSGATIRAASAGGQPRSTSSIRA